METTRQPDIFIASNRLPVTVQKQPGRVEVERSAGGLASALRNVGGVRAWIGWPGAAIEVAQRATVQARLQAEGLVPVFLSADEERSYYVNMCNGTLWPLLHYFPGSIEFHDRAYEVYELVNRRFAATLLERVGKDDVVWIHDFHLMLVPALLRAERPELRIGFFLHVPFPSQELWRLLPQREELLRGLLGADYIGFHTADYLRHFRNACLRVLGLEAGADSLLAHGRRIGLGVEPLGADVAHFQGLLAGDAVARHLAECERRWHGRRLVLGVERLDYSKGILPKLRAFARLLETEPARREDTVMLQVVVPSRAENRSYRLLLEEIEREVGRINGRFGAPGRMPLEFVHRGIEPAELAALYRHAAVAMVTPLRDGMNLVAHEFVLCQGHPVPAGSQHRGVLVLSEFAGASLSLLRALPVNPMDLAGLASALGAALAMPVEEKAERTADMYERAVELDSAAWAARFLRRLDRAAAHNTATRRAVFDAAAGDEIVRRCRAAPLRLLFLDYDGTLREIAQRPEQAAPNAELLRLLARLAALPATEVHVVSGRRRQTLLAWLGNLPLWLAAEHGFARRRPGGPWTEPVVVDRTVLARVEAMLLDACEQVPGSHLERKACGLAWHYRLAELGYGSWRARELRSALDELLRDQPFATLAGHAVLEVRARGIDKGRYLAAALAATAAPAGAFVLVAGDDRTDEDMYQAAPADAVRLHVGGPLAGTQALPTPADLRRLLAACADQITPR
ncbi:MAG: bifunctional alpha,alpha-trehalose-phosphate synthase (UDP-forming)/trehalose-phosphatase [Planctomycetes bacterium]|nr:bifunctional alpha,alpha-trehalose-phosphate synthase (UDP-forming)/trehalose-phosphatase [Planctomycetota bacterium]